MLNSFKIKDVKFSSCFRQYLYISLLFVTILITSCSDMNRSDSTDEMQNLIGQQTLLESEINSTVSAISFLKNKLAVQKAELRSYEDKVSEFILNHKMATAAIITGAAGAGIALDVDNEFSEEVENIAGVATAIAITYAIFNFDEVSFVFDELTKADAHVKTLKSQIELTESQLRNEGQILLQHQSELSFVSSQISQFKS